MSVQLRTHKVYFNLTLLCVCAHLQEGCCDGVGERGGGESRHRGSCPYSSGGAGGRDPLGDSGALRVSDAAAAASAAACILWYSSLCGDYLGPRGCFCKLSAPHVVHQPAVLVRHSIEYVVRVVGLLCFMCRGGGCLAAALKDQAKAEITCLACCLLQAPSMQALGPRAEIRQAAAGWVPPLAGCAPCGLLRLRLQIKQESTHTPAQESQTCCA